MHVSSDLSAYIDQELAPAEQARVSAHLEGCGRCAERLADLRATATLMAALPALRPSRSLVPSLAPRWNWLRPMRSFSAVTSGAFLMVFLIASVAQSGSNLGGGGALTPFGGAPAAAPAAATAGDATLQAPAGPFSATATAATAEDSQGAEAERAVGTTGEEGAAELRVEQRDQDLRATSIGPEPPTPLIWLGLSLIAAVLGLAAHWRLRAA